MLGGRLQQADEAGPASLPAAPEVDPKGSDYPLATDFTNVQAGREEPGAGDGEIRTDLNDFNDLPESHQDTIN